MLCRCTSIGRPLPPIKECHSSGPTTLSSATNPSSHTFAFHRVVVLAPWPFPFQQLFLGTSGASTLLWLSGLKPHHRPRPLSLPCSRPHVTCLGLLIPPLMGSHLSLLSFPSGPVQPSTPLTWTATASLLDPSCPGFPCSRSFPTRGTEIQGPQCFPTRRCYKNQRSVLVTFPLPDTPSLSV